MSVAVDERHQLTQFLSERLLTQPYPGIRPFEEDEWPLFFGRQAIVEQLLERLSAERFVAGEGRTICNIETQAQALGHPLANCFDAPGRLADVVLGRGALSHRGRA